MLAALSLGGVAIAGSSNGLTITTVSDLLGRVVNYTDVWGTVTAPASLLEGAFDMAAEQRMVTKITMYSSCVPSGLSYLFALGAGAGLIVLSSWVILLMRAVYRDDGGFRRGLANAAPLWLPALTGVVTLFNFKNSVIGWAQTCLPADDWSAPGSVFIGLGLAVALTAVGRLIYNRVRVGTTGEPVDNGDENSPLPASSGEAPVAKRPRNLPVERRRVIVEYVATYGVAVLIIVIGAGLAWT